MEANSKPSAFWKYLNRAREGLFYGIILTVALPKTLVLNNLLIFGWVASLLAHPPFYRQLRQLLRQPLIYLLVGWYLLFLLGFFYPGDPWIYLHQLEYKLGLLVFPLAIGGWRPSARIARNAQKAFVLGNLLLFLLALVLSPIRHAAQFPEVTFPDYYLSGHLVYFVGLSRPFVGVFQLLCLAFLWGNRLFPLKGRWLISLVHLLFLALLQLKLAFLLLPFLLLFLVCSGKCYAYLRPKIFTGIIGTALLLLLGAIMGLSHYGFDKLFPQTYQKALKSYNPEDHTTGSTARLVTYQAGYELIREAPWTGYGAKRARFVMKEYYQQIGFVAGVKMLLSAHNQYLQSWLEWGIAGPIMLLVLLLASLHHHYRHQETPGVLLVLAFMVFCLTDGPLARNTGIIPFAFFNSLLIFYRRETAPSPTKP